jgi:hypothetical protein
MFTVVGKPDTPCSFDTLLDDPTHTPSTTLNTDSLSASVCLGCFLHANAVLAAEAPNATPSDLRALQPVGHVGTLTVFPTRARVLAHVCSMQAHRCDMCISTYKTTGIWYEAGVLLDKHTHAVVAPTITPFRRTIVVCTTVDSTSLTDPYAGFWVGFSTSNARPFRHMGARSSFAEAMDALDAVALYQNDKDVRVLAAGITQQLAMLLITACREATTMQEVVAVVKRHEWTHSEQYVVHYIMDMWLSSVQSHTNVQDTVLDAATAMANGLPRLRSAKARIDDALCEILRRVEPMDSECFLEVVKDTCVEHRVVPYWEVADYILNTVGTPQLSNALPTDNLPRIQLKALRQPFPCVAALRGLEYNSNTLAEVLTTTTRPAFACALGSGFTERTVTMFSLKQDVLAIRLRRTSLAPVRLLPLPVAPQGVLQWRLIWHRSKHTLRTLTRIPNEASPHLIMLAEPSVEDRPTAYLCTFTPLDAAEATTVEVHVCLPRKLTEMSVANRSRYTTHRLILAYAVLQLQCRIGAWESHDCVGAAGVPKVLAPILESCTVRRVCHTIANQCEPDAVESEGTYGDRLYAAATEALEEAALLVGSRVATDADVDELRFSSMALGGTREARCR